jgi:hypothetical protein
LRRFGGVSLTADLQHVDSLSEIGTKLGLVLVIFSFPTKRSGTLEQLFLQFCSQGDRDADRRRDTMHWLSFDSPELISKHFQHREMVRLLNVAAGT